jgi:hypothetical protein
MEPRAARAGGPNSHQRTAQMCSTLRQNALRKRRARFRRYAHHHHFMGSLGGSQADQWVKCYATHGGGATSLWEFWAKGSRETHTPRRRRVVGDAAGSAACAVVSTRGVSIII